MRFGLVFSNTGVWSDVNAPDSAFSFIILALLLIFLLCPLFLLLPSRQEVHTEGCHRMSPALPKAGAALVRLYRCVS